MEAKQVVINLWIDCAKPEDKSCNGKCFGEEKIGDMDLCFVCGYYKQPCNNTPEVE